MLTQARLKELLNYDPGTGIFINLINRCAARAGMPIGSLSKEGYLHAGIDMKVYALHRLAWLYMTGSLPNGQVDHIDGCRSNNAFSNLRDVHKDINVQNQKKAQRSNKSTGVLGTFVNTTGVGFCARISFNNKKHYLGTFKTVEEAHEAYLKAKRELHEGCTI